MRQMKESGIKWIGKIPDSWKTERLKALFSFGKGLPITKDNLVAEGISVISYGQIHSKYNDGVHIRDELFRYVPEVFLKSNPDSLVHFGDIIVADTSEDLDGCGNALQIDSGNVIFAGYHTIILRSIKEQDNRFFAYTMLTDNWRSQLRGLASGVKVFSISKRMLSDCYYIVPPYKIRCEISDFLDSQCAIIDNIIEKTRASIEEYKKLKQAIITRTVTKGVRGDRTMKDSGVEWIGEMPTDWDLIPFRHVLKERQEKNIPIKTEERLSLSIELGVTLYAEKTTNLDRFKDDFEQYKLAHVGDLVMNSMNMIVGATGVSDYYGCVSPVYYTFYDETPGYTTAKYCEYLFRSKTMLRVLYSLGKGIYAIVRGDDRVNTCRLKVSKEDLKSILIPLPSLKEQTEILGYLNEATSAIDVLIEEKETLLRELELYKKSMIYEYVTGKKEVPSA